MPDTTVTATTLHEALAAQVTASPDRVAVSAPDGSMTYQQLDERSDALADRLRQAGVAAGDLVVLSTGRTLEMIVGLVAIARSGAAYLPVDPGVPAVRLRWLVEQAGAVLTLTDGSTAAGSGADVMLVAGGRPDPVLARPGTGAAAAGDSDPLAYVIYTSGSTGEPKGVAVSHRNVLALLEQTEELFRFTAEDVWTMFHSIAFDFSVWEIWGSLLHGGRLVVVGEDVARSPAAFLRLLTPGAGHGAQPDPVGVPAAGRYRNRRRHRAARPAAGDPRRRAGVDAGAATVAGAPR